MAELTALERAEKLSHLRDRVIEISGTGKLSKDKDGFTIITDGDPKRFQAGWQAMVNLGSSLGVNITGAANGEIPDDIPEHLHPIIKEIFANPSKAKTLTSEIRKSPEITTALSSTVSSTSLTGSYLIEKGASTATKTASTAKSLYNNFTFALNNPGLTVEAGKLAYEAKQVSDKIDAAVKANPNLKNIAKLKEDFIAQQSFDLTSLTPEKIATSKAQLAQISGFADAFNKPEYKQTVEMVDGLIGKTMAGDGKLKTTEESQAQLLATLGSAQDFENFAKEFEQVLTDHPAVTEGLYQHKSLSEIIVSKFDVTTPVNPETATNFQEIYKNPKQLAYFNNRLKENPGILSLVGGTFDVKNFGSFSNVAAFLTDNPTILDTVNSPQVTKLLANSDFKKKYGIVYDQLQSKTVKDWSKQLGVQMSVPEDGHALSEDEKEAERKKNPIGQILTAWARQDYGTLIKLVCDMITGGKGIDAFMTAQNKQQDQDKGNSQDNSARLNIPKEANGRG